MKKVLFSLLCSFLLSQSFAQTDNQIVLGTIDSIHSKILQEQRKIWIYLPNSSASGMSAKTKYPVVYLLDAETNFNFVAAMIQRQSAMSGNVAYPEMIVVGITNTDRNRDLTPTHVDSFQIAPNLSVALKTSGGGEQFIAFIEKELMPYIDSAYPTLPYKILIGHSFGGLTVMNTFINHKNLFNAYVAIDPSMWWDENNLLHKAQMTLPAENYNHKTLFLGIAHTMSKGMDTATVRKDTSILTQHIRAILSLNELLQQSKRNGLSYDYKYYKHDTHSSVNLIAVYDALRFIFDSDSQITDNDMLNPSVNIIEQIEKRYKKLSEQFGFKCNAPEALINELGNEEMMLKNMDAAEQLFKMNVTNYPTGFKVYDAMGDFYTAKNDQAKAIEYYKKALAIHENADSRKKLNSLLKK